MPNQNGSASTGGVMPPEKATANISPKAAMVRVWDPFVRVFHWSLVGLFALAFITGDEIEKVHIMAGYAIVGLVVLRIIWGFVGSRHARFSDFVRSPQAILTYLGSVLRGQSPRYVGHNPAGGAMVLVLLAMIAAIATTGYMMTTDAYWGSEGLEDIHEGLVNATLVFVALHVAGAVFTGLAHRENLVKAMITGRKRAS